tara:strand:+ start:3211 stop:4554 length:1344 start_codon:yes stop_codon:yes gene_type:complete
MRILNKFEYKNKINEQKKMHECSICVEKYNNSNRAKVICPYCEKHCCTSCFCTYLLGNNKTVADCMHCNRELSLEFIKSKCTKKYYSVDYRNKRANDLLSQERSLLPDTQHLVERQILEENHDVKLRKYQDKIKEYKIQIKYIQDEMRVENVNFWRLMDENRTVKKEKRKFIMQCPTEECRGFLSSAWKCGTCQIYICSNCRQIKNGRDDPLHECNPDDVATSKMIATETKPCPKCAVPIFKIDGCDQMWCVECETPFSWKTLEIVTGVIHNPHFYQRQRERNGGVAPRVHGDNPCGGIQQLPYLRAIDRKIRTDNITWEKYAEIHRLIEHIRGVTIHYYPNRENIRNNVNLRIDFLRNKISEEKWMSILKRRQKEMEKNREVHNILELLYVSLTDVFNMYISDNLDTPEQACKELQQYCNRELSKVRNTYNMRIPFIDKNWTVKIK